MNRDHIKTKVRHYIHKHAGEEVGDTVALFEQQIVNSLFAISLMSYIEKEFKVKFGMEDMDWGRLRTVETIADFVLDKMRAP